jgi:hypothetical protein
MNYDVIPASDHSTLVQKLNKAIAKGWTPLGGVATGGSYEAEGNTPRLNTSTNRATVSTIPMVMR